MRDYVKLLDWLRSSQNACYIYGCDECPADCENHEGDIFKDAADAIEELKDQIADVSKMICDLIAYAQKNADESREAEQRHYGSDSTVNVYTWMHNVKCVHERYVAMLDDIATKLPEPPKEDSNENHS